MEKRRRNSSTFENYSMASSVQISGKVDQEGEESERQGERDVILSSPVPVRRSDGVCQGTKTT